MNYIQRNKKFLSVYLVWVLWWVFVFSYYRALYEGGFFDHLNTVRGMFCYNMALAPLIIYFLYQSFKKPKK